MRVAQLVERHRFEITEAPVPEPGAGEVLVKVHAVGLCGSDLHNFSEGAVGDMPTVYPMVLGHEPAGTVVSTGAGVTGWAPGDRVMLEPAIYCYHCEFCLSGHYNLCENLRFLSQPGEPGYFRDYVTIPAGNLVRIPDGMSFEVATLFEPLAVAVHSMKFARVKLGDTVAVFGAGPIGLLTIACVKLAGATKIIAVEPVAARRELALHAGADAVIDPEAEDPRESVMEQTNHRGVEVAIDCVARGGTLNHSIHITRRAGRVVVTGIPRQTRVGLDYHVMRRKEVHLYTVRRSNDDTRAAVKLMVRYPERIHPVVTHTRPFDEIQQAFELVEAYGDGVGKLVLLLD